MDNTIEYKGHSINITQDAIGDSPREWDNLATLVCFHGRYELGDKDHGYVQSDYESFDELETAILRDNPNAIVLPLSLYDHSGITIKVGHFDCPWDSGQVGFAFLSLKKARENYGWKRITAKRREKLETYIRNEVKTYDDFLTGNVYGFNVTDANGDDIEDGSCYGFYGYDHEKSELLTEAKSAIDYNIEKVKKTEIKNIEKANAQQTELFSIAH